MNLQGLAITGQIKIIFSKEIQFEDGSGIIDYLAKFYDIHDKTHTVRIKTPYSVNNKPLIKCKDEVWYIVGLLMTDYYKKDDQWNETQPYIKVFQEHFLLPEEITK